MFLTLRIVLFVTSPLNQHKQLRLAFLTGYELKSFRE